MRLMLAYFERFVGKSGGIERVCCNMANEMIRRGHEVCITYCFGGEGKPFYPLDEKTAVINLMDVNGQKGARPDLSQCVPAWEKAVREGMRLFSKKAARQWNESYKGRMIRENIRDAVERFRPDLIISFRYETSNYLINSAGITIPVITMFHIDPDSALKTAPSGELSALEKSVFAQVLLPSDREKVQGYCPKANVVWIPNIVPQYQQTADLEKEKDTYHIINVARLNKKQKRQHLLIDAFSRIADRFPQWTVEFWGGEDSKGEYTSELKDQIRQTGLEKRIFLRGTSEDILPVYLQADIFCLPSAYEGFPAAMTEAMSAGLPVVAFRTCPAVHELTKDGVSGFLAEDGPAALAEKLAILMQSREKRVQFGAAARRAMHQKRYSAVGIWDSWESLMKEAVAQRQKSDRLAE